ncbi:MAG: hypothetical protein JXB15_04115 [Anaerolineales bacterium]|nr:hypothetical protein [Anaerolineales bacterium]
MPKIKLPFRQPARKPKKQPEARLPKITISPAERVILVHTVLVGASSLIPIPLLDDYLAATFQRLMVKELFKVHGRQALPAEVAWLSMQSAPGCSNGCLFLVKYLIKDLVREVLFFLEWQRGLSMATQAYYLGYLLNEVFENGLYQPGRVDVIHMEIDQARKGADTHLVYDAIKRTFRSTRGMWWALAKFQARAGLFYVRLAYFQVGRQARAFWRWLRRKPEPAQDAAAAIPTFEQIFDTRRPQIDDLLDELALELQQGIGGLSKSHFDGLRSTLMAGLANHGIVPQITAG